MKSLQLSASWLWSLPALLLYACQSPGKKTDAAALANDSLYKQYQLDKIQLPPGFSISVFAKVPNARSMAWGSKGTLFVGNRAEDGALLISDDKNGLIY